MTLRLIPVTFADACGFVAMWHRHLDAWGCTLTGCPCQFTPWSLGMRPSKVTPADDNDATAVLPRAESSGVHCSPVLTGPAERSVQ